MTTLDPHPAQPLGELEFRRLLVAIDGSEGSELALSAAVTSARRNNASITLLAISPPVHAWAGSSVAAPVVQNEVDTGMQAVLRDAIARIPDDIGVHTVFRQGKPGPEIVALATSGDFDAVLLGARGVGRVHGLVGSVSQYVLHHAPIAVIVAHPPRATND